MTEKSLTEMTDDEIITEIQNLRERRAKARERRITEKNAESVPKVRKGPEEIGGDLGNLLDDIFGDTT